MVVVRILMNSVIVLTQRRSFQDVVWIRWGRGCPPEQFIWKLWLNKTASKIVSKYITINQSQGHLCSLATKMRPLSLLVRCHFKLSPHISGSDMTLFHHLLFKSLIFLVVFFSSVWYILILIRYDNIFGN